MADEQPESDQDAGSEAEPVLAPPPEPAPSEPESIPAEPINPSPVAQEVPGWPGVIAETPEAHDARRRAEAGALA